MPYILVENFNGGLDRRRKISTAPAGTLWELTNAHITRGGEIEKRKSFVDTFDLPANTFGIGNLLGSLYVFGAAETPVGMPAGVSYQRLAHPNGNPSGTGSTAMIEIVDVDAFDGRLYVIAKYADNSIYHFYDGNRITYWDSGTIQGGATSTSDIATSIANLIDADSAYAASAVSNVVTVTASVANVPFTISGNITGAGSIIFNTTVPAASSTAQVTTLTISGTWVAGDTYEIILNGTVFGGNTTNYVALTLDTKMYVAAGSILRYSKINSAILWDDTVTTNVGAGFINISNHYSGSDSLTALAVCGSDLSIFARRAIQIWHVEADDSNNIPIQKINSTGTRSPRSVVSYTDSAVLYLADSGIRTLRPRTSTSQATTNDIGRPIDTLVIAQMKTLTDAQIIAAPSVVDPVDGRYWLALGNIIYVLSSFPASGQGNISAWSTYEPGFVVEHMLAVDNRIYVRSGNKIYLYGGVNNDTYDNSTVTIQLPFLDAKKPADFKQLAGINFDALGTFDVTILVDPDDLTQYVDMGSISNFTYIEGNIDALGDTTHFAPRLVSTDSGKVTLSNISVNYEALGPRQ